MKVILLERVEKLGQMGDVVTVKNGFARNFLLPQGKAERATSSAMEAFESRRSQLEAQNLKLEHDLGESLLIESTPEARTKSRKWREVPLSVNGRAACRSESSFLP